MLKLELRQRAVAGRELGLLRLSVGKFVGEDALRKGSSPFVHPDGDTRFLLLLWLVAPVSEPTVVQASGRQFALILSQLFLGQMRSFRC